MNSINLLREIQDGNQKSFKHLFHLYYEPLVIYAEGYLFDRASSEDIVQEVFIYLWENADKIHIKTSLKGYLYRMVRNKILNYLKTIKLTDKIEVLDFVPFVENQRDYQEEKIKKLNTVLSHVETMPPRMKEIFNLKFRQNYSNVEISSQLNISINTVKTQIRRAKSLLQNHFPFYLFLIFLLDEI